MVEWILGDESDKLIEGDITFSSDIAVGEHLLNFLFGGLMSESFHGLLPLLDI